MGDDAGQQQQVDHRGAEGEGAAEVDAGGHAHPGYGYPPHMRPPPPGSYPGYPPAPGGPPGAPQGQPGGYPPPAGMALSAPARLSRRASPGLPRRAAAAGISRLRPPPSSGIRLPPSPGILRPLGGRRRRGRGQEGISQEGRPVR